MLKRGFWLFLQKHRSPPCGWEAPCQVVQSRAAAGFSRTIQPAPRTEMGQNSLDGREFPSVRSHRPAFMRSLPNSEIPEGDKQVKTKATHGGTAQAKELDWRSGRELETSTSKRGKKERKKKQ